jgi:uncharacterized protein
MSRAQTEPSWTHGRFYWNELMTHSVEKTKAFYKQTLGWTFEPMPMENGSTYWVIKAADQMVGGLFEMREPGMERMPDQWVAYIAVDDVDARVKKAVAAGAHLMKPVFDIPNVGRNAVLREPSGAMICWMTPSK